ncbi:MAG: right-handed parallel beta-helix repeat-containing protein [Acetobacteraceae bacterium]|nr:right-handed parallel beta-helix repeat-containing protein [Acetobacteraceae bacterium]
MSRLLFALMTLVVTHAASAAVLEVGPGKTYETLSAAEAAASAGDTLRLSAGEHFDCAAIRHANITIEGSGKPEETVLTDKACQGKGLLITQGANITVRNLTLTRARVPDGNGAGIRAEGANLLVDHVRFVNNQDGILSNDNPTSTITVQDSEFLRNGACNPSCAHGIYAGHIQKLVVLRSRFFETKQAHHVKSRAAQTEVIDSDLQDGANGTSSYAIDVPNGGGVLVRGCTIQKGPLSENHTGAIVIGAEGVTQRTPAIRIEGNIFHRDGDYPTAFVVNLTATEAELVGNKVAPGIKPLTGDGTVH